MKTAEEWAKEVLNAASEAFDNTHYLPEDLALPVIKAIQLDAWKAGLIAAYELAPVNCNEETYFYQKKIYNLLDNPPKHLI